MQAFINKSNFNGTKPLADWWLFNLLESDGARIVLVGKPKRSFMNRKICGSHFVIKSGKTVLQMKNWRAEDEVTAEVALSIIEAAHEPIASGKFHSCFRHFFKFFHRNRNRKANLRKLFVSPRERSSAQRFCCSDKKFVLLSKCKKKVIRCKVQLVENELEISLLRIVEGGERGGRGMRGVRGERVELSINAFCNVNENRIATWLLMLSPRTTTEALAKL